MKYGKPGKSMGIGYHYIKVLPRYLPGITGKSQPGQPMSQLRFKLSTSWI